MTDSRYLQVFGDATDALFRYAGVDEGYADPDAPCTRLNARQPQGGGAARSSPLYVTTRVLKVDDKRVRLFHSLHRRRECGAVATAEAAVPAREYHRPERPRRWRRGCARGLRTLQAAHG